MTPFTSISMHCLLEHITWKSASSLSKREKEKTRPFSIWLLSFFVDDFFFSFNFRRFCCVFCMLLSFWHLKFSHVYFISRCSRTRLNNFRSKFFFFVFCTRRLAYRSIQLSGIVEVLSLFVRRRLCTMHENNVSRWHYFVYSIRYMCTFHIPWKNLFRFSQFFSLFFSIIFAFFLQYLAIMFRFCVCYLRMETMSLMLSLTIQFFFCSSVSLDVVFTGRQWINIMLAKSYHPFSEFFFSPSFNGTLELFSVLLLKLLW